MYNKINELLNVVIGTAVSMFTGHASFVWLDHSRRPEVYKERGEPWYTSIAVYGALSAVVVILALAGKLLVRDKLEK